MVRKEGAANTHHDFCVRRGVVLRALQWLLANNRYYLNVRINVDALALLPDDRNLNGLHSITLDSTIDDPEPLSAQNEDPYDAHLSASFVPSTTQWMTVQETIRQSVQERQPHQQQMAPPTVSWPVLLTLLLHDRLLSLSGTTFWCTQMADLPDTLVFATLPSTQRCAGGHYRQAGSMSASTHMMPSSFSSIVLTWLLFISTIIVL